MPVSENPARPGWPGDLIAVGKILYAICIIGLGVQQIQYADFQPVILPEWPSFLHEYILAYAIGIALILAGILIILNKKARIIAFLLGIFFLFCFFCFHVIYQCFIIQYSFHLGLWTDALKELALSGGAFVVAGSFKENAFITSGKLMETGRIFFSLMLILFGIDHLLYTDFVAGLVPSWIPFHLFWTYFGAVALSGSGIAILLKIKLPQVSVLLGVMLLIWFLILHIPRAITDPHSGNGNEITSVFEALGFAGIAFIIAGLYKKNRNG
ncbi:MAG: hypothetical protein QM764_20140 [Chitinophagaceae bacterium]